MLGFCLQRKIFRSNRFLSDWLLENDEIIRSIVTVSKNQSLDYGSLYRFDISGAGELKKISNLMYEKQNPVLGLDSFLITYIHEVIVKLTQKKNHVGLFDLYQRTVKQLLQTKQQTQKRQVILYFQYHLLHLIGYGIDFSIDFKNQLPISKQHNYFFYPNVGFCTQNNNNPISGQSILDFLTQKPLNHQQLNPIKIILKKQIRTVHPEHFDTEKIINAIII